MLTPCDKYPNCPKCPPQLSTDKPDKDYTCVACGALRMALWDVESEVRILCGGGVIVGDVF